MKKLIIFAAIAVLTAALCVSCKQKNKDIELLQNFVEEINSQPGKDLANGTVLTKCEYKGTSGTNVVRDFVELPSQINEHWATEPEVLKMYAKHYQTGEVIPDEIIEKILQQKTFNQGFMTTELLAAAILDMNLHTVTDVKNIDMLAFEKEAMDKLGLIPEIAPRYRVTYFNHIIGGYAAGYYSYLWANVLDNDAFEAFKEHGIFDKNTADLFRHNVLEKGDSEDPMVLYRNFRGAEPSLEPLLKNRGMK